MEPSAAKSDIALSPLAAARVWVERCLVEDGSVLGDDAVWTAENADILDRLFIQQPDAGEGTFLEKLEVQLEGAPSKAVKLAAEVLWILHLFPRGSTLRGPTKRLQIRRVWEWSGEPFPVDHPFLNDPLDTGIGWPGMGFQTLRWMEFRFAIRVLQALKVLSGEDRRRLLGNSWDLAAWLDEIEEGRRRQFRHILLHLLFPETFSAIVSLNQKRKIASLFDDEYEVRGAASDGTGLDRVLYMVREQLSGEYGKNVDFGSPGVWERWNPRADEEDGGDPEDDGWPHHSPDDAQRWWMDTFGSDVAVWLMAAGKGGRLLADFRDEGRVRMGLGDLDDLTAFESREAIEAALAEERGGGPRPVHDSMAGWEFSHVMKPGDVLVLKRGRGVLLGWGRVASGYRHDADLEEHRHVREVKWERTGSWALPKSQHVTPKTLTRVDSSPEWVRAAIEVMEGMSLATTAPSHGGLPSGGYSTERAMEDLFLDPSQFTAILDALARKKAVILEGPPGVGKSFIARRVAYALLDRESPEQVGLVQFHQSYAYEDFVQGLRPAPGGGFQRGDGAFLRFCERARQRPDEPFVFIIDEINRANLSRVFGELLLLLEADKRRPEYAVELTYSTQEDAPFFVPPNVHVLGLMNTADRSLALVDYALRRRFAFIRLEPAFKREVFGAHLVTEGVDEELVHRIIQGMTRLNREIREDARNLGHGYEVGHSYFVPSDEDEARDEEWFAAVVRNEIGPLLREYWFDDPARADRWVQELLRGP